tara:strand:- start:135 stop:1355 length:1221 start_codon:yes stop_codon:yes gene_type:complete
MSYPGYLSPSTNVPADVALERSVGTFNFVLNTGGGAGPASTLQSPASIVPFTDGSVTLTADATLNAPSNVVITSPNSRAALQLDTNNGETIYVTTRSTQGGILAIGGVGDYVSDNVFIDTVNNNVTLTNTGVEGTTRVQNLQIYGTSIGNANKLLLAPNSAASSLIYQSVASSGTLGLGSSASNEAGIVVSDVARSGGLNSYVKIQPNNNTVDTTSIILAPAQANLPITNIFADTASGTGGQLNLASNNTGNGLGSGVSIRDAGITLTNPIDPDFPLNTGTGPQIITGQINNGSPLAGGQFFILPTNPPGNGTATGLYCIMIRTTTPSIGEAPNVQLSTMAYWDGSTQTWTFGGSAFGAGMTPQGCSLGFGLNPTSTANLYFGYGSGVSNVIATYVMVPMYQSLGI